MLGAIPVCVIKVQDSVRALGITVINMGVGLEYMQVEIWLVIPRQHHCDRAAAECPWRLDCPVSGISNQAHESVSIVGQVPLQRMIHSEVQIRAPSCVIYVGGKWGRGEVAYLVDVLSKILNTPVVGIGDKGGGIIGH